MPGTTDFDTKFYNAGDIVLVCFGVTISKGRGKSGYAEGTFLEIEQDGKDFDVKKGADGSATRFNRNESVTYARVHLMQSSSSNAVFSAMLNKDVSGTNGAGVGSLLAKDNGGTSFFESAACWVTGPPKRGYGVEPDEVVWEICCTKTLRLDGGN